MHAENGLPTLHIRVADHHLAVEPPGTEECGIEDVLPVRGGDDDDARLWLEAIHLDEQLIQRLLALLVAEGVAAAAPADGVELIDEHDAGPMTARVAEQAPDPGRSDAGVHLDEVGAAGEEKRHARFARDGTGQQGLAGSRRSNQEHALGNPAADGREALRVAEELDDLLHLVLCFIDAGDVLEGDDLIARFGELRATRRVDPS